MLPIPELRDPVGEPWPSGLRRHAAQPHGVLLVQRVQARSFTDVAMHQ